jgi:tetratricopeptide (TPR) repeat protein
MGRIGEALFTGVFGSGDARDLWAALRPELGDTRIAIATGVREAAAIPWELIRDPKTEARLALAAHSFVRVHSQAAVRPRLPGKSEGRIRILLVICRPGRDDDVPFRSVASRLLKGLSGAARESFELDLLRPPTFEQLGRTLRAARAGEHGYVVFENPAVEDNRQLVDGPALGRLLAETGVPVLVLNACRSAHAEPPSAPVSVGAENPHAEVRAFGSLAQEVMDAGAAAVVAMRYNVYVESAAQFVGELYARLVEGNPLGEAASLGRKQLADQPLRSIAYDPRPLQDWLVPVVYEAAPVEVFPRSEAKLSIRLGGAAVEESLDRDLPPRPGAGFYGRDETLRALDRAFDTQPIVLLHAWAGSGKTATAAEFARWYALTGGIEGPVLFTSFEQYKPLTRVLDHFGKRFEARLERAGVQWLALSDEQRRDVALQVMRQVPLLWVWDNVEPVAGFPRGTPSAWSEAEQQELVRFLQDARETKAKFLLTSRRDERDWLGGLPARIVLRPMPMREMLELTRALAEKRQRRITDVEDWRPLLRFTQGNPLTLKVVVGQALRGVRMEEFVEQLRAGEAVFEDEASEGRTRSLGASLNYGFEHAFTEAERKQLAVLHLFQGFVDVDALKWMGRPDKEWCLPEVRGLDREQWIALLDRAADVGLLTPHGGGYYGSPPALPWFFRKLFEEHYAGSKTQAARAYVEAMGALGSYYGAQYADGNRDVIAALTAEEANLLHSWRLARAKGWWDAAANTIQGLRVLYDHTGRRREWKRLVKETVPEFVDPATDGPLPGREDDWSLVTNCRVQLARAERNWLEAERLQRLHVDWNHKRAGAVLELPPNRLDTAGRRTIRVFAGSLLDLGQALREQEKPECVPTMEAALENALQIGDQPFAAVCAFNLGTAYKSLPAIRDLSKAEELYRCSLGLAAEGDRLGRSRCHGQLGFVAWERSKEARKAGMPEMEILGHLKDAARAYHAALDLLPPDAVSDLAVAHGQLGVLYADTHLDRALRHYRESIRYYELAADLFRAGRTRYNVALALRDAGRFEDALQYAQAALRNFEPYGEGAREVLQRTYQLIAEIERDLNTRRR